MKASNFKRAVVGLWVKHEKMVVDYSDVSSETKFLIAHSMTISPALILSYIIFFFILGSDFHLGIILVSIGYGRLFLAFIMEKNNCYFGEGYTPFLRYISYASLVFVTLAGTYLLIRDVLQN